MTQINDPNNLGSDLFAMKLNYEAVDANIAGAAQYNGNISQQIWATSTAARHAYGYTYDQLNQLSVAEYEKYSSSWNQDAGRFNESATYDLNGNILTMTRGGKTGTSSYGSMDNITMSYSGNKLIGANDAVTGITGNYQFQEAMVSTVVEGNTSTHEYLYDVNGNMTQDKNKGITVVYNYLNLPIQVNFGPNNRIDWTYTATGAKLQKKVYTNGNLTLTQDYVSGFVYKNGSLDFYSTETGRVKNQSGTLKYQYTLTDHLGNTRVMFEETSGTPTAIEESHYYAFGMRIEGLSTSNPDNKFTYNGKELEDDHGLNWYHYGARFYDAQIGRWHVVDPADELTSPYSFVKNNPIKLVDPNGQEVSISQSLLNNEAFRQWADNSLAFKQLVGLFGKGGPLEKYTRIEINEYNRGDGQTEIRYNSSGSLNIFKFPKKWNVDPDGYYSAVIKLNPAAWNRNSRQTGDHEIDHVMYSALIIVKAKKGEEVSILVGINQDSKEGVPNNGTDYSSQKLAEILRELGVDDINLPEGSLEDLTKQGTVLSHEQPGFFQSLWNDIKTLFTGKSEM